MFACKMRLAQNTCSWICLMLAFICVAFHFCWFIFIHKYVTSKYISEVSFAQYIMSLVDLIRAKLDAKCSMWGCPQGDTLYDDLHPCTEALCRFRDYFTHGATDKQWSELNENVDAINAINWPSFLAKVLKSRALVTQKHITGGLFYYRGGIHTRGKADRLIEKILEELDRAVVADPNMSRGYFVRAEALIGELEYISRRNITPMVAFMVVVIIIVLILYFAAPSICSPKNFGHL